MREICEMKKLKALNDYHLTYWTLGVADLNLAVYTLLKHSGQKIRKMAIQRILTN